MPTLSHPLNTLARDAGLRGTMLHFSARTLPVVVGSYPAINLGGPTDEYTVEVWVRADPTQTPHAGTTLIPIVSWSYKDSSRDPYPFAIFLNMVGGTSARPKVIRQYEGGTAETIQATVALNDGLFHHIAMVRRLLDSNTAYIQIYLDGDTDPTWVVQSAVSGSCSADAGALLTIGGGLIAGNSDYFYSGFNGDISQVRVWAGALSATQIAALRYEALMGPIEVLDAQGGQAHGTVRLSGNSIAGTVLATGEGVEYATLNDGTSSTDTPVAALVPGTTGNAAVNAINTVVSLPSGGTTVTVTSSTAITGGTDPLGGQCATGSVTLTNSGASFTVPLGFLVQVGASGPSFALTSAGTINANSNATFFVRATDVGTAGNVAASAINTLSFPNLAPNISVNNSAATSGGVNPVNPENAYYSTGLLTITNNNQTRAVTLPAGTVVGSSSGGHVNPNSLFSLRQQVIVPAHGSVSNVAIVAVRPGSGVSMSAGAINWISPLYLGPGDAVTVTNPASIASVPPRRIQLVGCWTCDEGFGKIVYNYAANQMSMDNQGNGSFGEQIWGVYSLSTFGNVPSDLGDPEWVITTLMAPPPFVT